MDQHVERAARFVDPRALREQLSLPDEADIRSPQFQRFVIRLSEALDLDVPAEHAQRLVTLSDCVDYVRARARA
jgi:hypothetical protein